MKTVLIVLFLCVAVTLGQITWTNRARVRRHTEFFSEVMQETVYELERRGFSSLTLLNITQRVDLQMYRWHVNGTVHYTNGFLVSIQKIDVTSMRQAVSVLNISGVHTPRATVSGTLNLRDIKLGYDVIFNQTNGVVHKFTGDFTHSLIAWAVDIKQNVTTKEVTVSIMPSLTSGLVRMVYRPANSITEVISRVFLPSNNQPGVRAWVFIISPIILDVIKNKVPFPDICYSHC